MKDLASFDFQILTNIWGRSRCILSGVFSTQWHHIEGRGGKKEEDRLICSSPFNAVPLGEIVHAYAPVNDPDLHAFFRRRAEEKVRYAVACGRYEITEIDRAFLHKYPLIETVQTNLELLPPDGHTEQNTDQQE